MKKIIIIAIVLIASLNTKAQNQIIGKVVEIVKDGSELPIPGANVYWEGTTIGAATSEMEISQLLSQQYFLQL